MVPCQEQVIFSKAVSTISHHPGPQVALHRSQVLPNPSETPSSALSATPHPPPPVSGGFCTALTRCPPLLFLRKDFSAHELPETAINYCQAWPQLSEPDSLSLEVFELEKKAIPFGEQMCDLRGQSCLHLQQEAGLQ